MKPHRIEITRDDRGNTVVNIVNTNGSIHDAASFVSAYDALEWVSKFVSELEPT